MGRRDYRQPTQRARVVPRQVEQFRERTPCPRQAMHIFPLERRPSPPQGIQPCFPETQTRHSIFPVPWQRPHGTVNFGVALVGLWYLYGFEWCDELSTALKTITPTMPIPTITAIATAHPVMLVADFPPLP